MEPRQSSVKIIQSSIVPTGSLKFTFFILCAISLDFYAAAEQETTIIPQFLNLAEGVPCGETQYTTRERILGGDQAEVGEFPYLASIQKSDNMHFCAGFLIGSNKILTAGHCFLDIMYGSESYKEYRILVGSNDWTDRSNLSNIYGISNVLIHPKYSYLKPNVENDIAILTLDRHVTWSPQIQPICLAMNDDRFYDNGIIAGWGIRSENEKMKDWMKDTTLHKVSLPIWSNSDCQDVYRRHRVNWNTRKTHLCAGYQGRSQDTSSGDSGSPIAILDEDGRRIAYGIVSVGEGSVLPGIYTRLSSFIPWIKAAISS